MSLPKRVPVEIDDSPKIRLHKLAREYQEILVEDWSKEIEENVPLEKLAGKWRMDFFKKIETPNFDEAAEVRVLTEGFKALMLVKKMYQYKNAFLPATLALAIDFIKKSIVATAEVDSATQVSDLLESMELKEDSEEQTKIFLLLDEVDGQTREVLHPVVEIDNWREMNIKNRAGVEEKLLYFQYGTPLIAVNEAALSRPAPSLFALRRGNIKTPPGLLITPQHPFLEEMRALKAYAGKEIPLARKFFAVLLVGKNHTSAQWRLDKTDIAKIKTDKTLHGIYKRCLEKNPEIMNHVFKDARESDKKLQKLLTAYKAKIKKDLPARNDDNLYIARFRQAIEQWHRKFSHVINESNLEESAVVRMLTEEFKAFMLAKQILLSPPAPAENVRVTKMACVAVVSFINSYIISPNLNISNLRDRIMLATEGRYVEKTSQIWRNAGEMASAIQIPLFYPPTDPASWEKIKVGDKELLFFRHGRVFIDINADNLGLSGNPPFALYEERRHQGILLTENHPHLSHLLQLNYLIQNEILSNSTDIDLAKKFFAALLTGKDLAEEGISVEEIEKADPRIISIYQKYVGGPAFDERVAVPAAANLATPNEPKVEPEQTSSMKLRSGG